MRCPFCDDGESQVVDSRLSEAGDAVRRRRRVPLLRPPLHHLRALRPGAALHPQAQRRPRAVRSRQAAGGPRAGRDQAADRARAARGGGRPDRRRAALAGRRRRAPTRWASWPCAGCASLDPVAYVRFASVYRKFGDVAEFEARAGAARCRAAAAARAPVRAVHVRRGRFRPNPRVTLLRYPLSRAERSPKAAWWASLREIRGKF